jgi:hypothetical protein
MKQPVVLDRPGGGARRIKAELTLVDKDEATNLAAYGEESHGMV